MRLVSACEVHTIISCCEKEAKKLGEGQSGATSNLQVVDRKARVMSREQGTFLPILKEENILLYH